MSNDTWGLHAPAYDQFLPDLDAIKSLDLNWDHGISGWDDGRNFGLIYLYSIGNTGHRYLAACAIPTLPPDHYPIALVNEEQPAVNVFASSITTWLPCYLLHVVDGWLKNSKYEREHPHYRPPQWRKDEIAQFLAEEDAIRVALQGFPVPGRDDLLTTLITMVRQRHTLDYTTWQPGTFLRDIEGPSPVGEYQQLADAETASLSDWQALIRKHPFYNKPLFHLFAQGPNSQGLYANKAYSIFASDSHSWKVSEQDLSTIPVELAYEVFHRRIAHDSTGIFATDVLECAARLVSSRRYEVDGPLFPLIHDLAKKGARETLLGEAFFEAGQRWEALGSSQAHHLQALTCYENAIILQAIDEEEWHWEALARVRELAATLGDNHYLWYLEDNLADLHPPE